MFNLIKWLTGIVNTVKRRREALAPHSAALLLWLPYSWKLGTMTTKAGVLRSLHLENVEADAMLLPVEAVYPSATALQAEKKPSQHV